MHTKPQRIVLVWSDPDIRTWRKGDRAVPLTAEAYMATRRLDDADVLDAKHCIGQPQMVDAAATELLNALHETLKSSKFPWFEAYANVIFETKAFQLIAWLTLIRSLQEQFKPRRIEISPPTVFSGQSWSHDMFIYRLVRESFQLARKILERENVLFTTVVPAIPSRPLRAQPLIRRIAAQGMSLGMSLGFLRSSGGSPTVKRVLSPLEEIDVLLVGQQYGDAFHSAPLAARLAIKYGKSFLWVSMRPQSAPNMTFEESALIANLNLEQLRFVDSASLLRSATEAKRSLLLDLGSAWQIAGLLAYRKEWGLNRAEWFDFLMDPDLMGFASRYQAWDAVLTALRPKVSIGLSVLQDMALIRAWTRRNEVPFVCFMHGAFYALKYSHDVDADYLGVFGRTLADQLGNSNLPQPRQVAPCGAMQFGDKVASSFRSAKHEETKSPSSDTVLFLGFFDSLPFCPWSPCDMWRMLRDVHEVCRECGKILRVRPHPRYPATSWSPFVEELERQSPGTIMLSSEPSLGSELEAADFVVASGFDGAVLDSLLARKLVISYLPEGVEHIDYSRLLEDVGEVARGVDQLRTLFAAVTTNLDRRSDLRSSQEHFLRSYVENPEGDPWQGALNLIEDALQERSQSSNNPAIAC